MHKAPLAAFTLLALVMATSAFQMPQFYENMIYNNIANVDTMPVG